VTAADLEFPLDFGSGVRACWTSWKPDRELNPQYEGIPDVERWGMILDHPDARNTAQRHHSGITFAGPVQAQIDPSRPAWQVESWEPLTLSPSILCNVDKSGCGLHGFIRQGLWVPA
jgi:uncharacterized protein DUF6527